jgi:hypothetical protein
LYYRFPLSTIKTIKTGRRDSGTRRAASDEVLFG